MVHAISRILGGGVHQVAIWGFKFDESTDPKEPRRFFSIGGLIASDSAWDNLEKDWEDCIVQQNSECRDGQKITGYHGSSMNSIAGEFKNWDKSLSRSFTSKMLGAISKSGALWFALCWDMDALRNEFPGGEIDKRKSAYFLGVMAATVTLGKIFHKKGHKAVFRFHHHEEWAALAIRAFKRIQNDARLPYRESLLSIAPIYNGNRAAEIADLCSYEAYREIKRRVLSPRGNPRYAYTWLSEHGVGSGLIWIDKEMVIGLREIMETRPSLTE